MHRSFQSSKPDKPVASRGKKKKKHAERQREEDRNTEREKEKKRMWKHFEMYKALNKCKYRWL